MMRCNPSYDVTVIDAGTQAIIVAHDAAARSVLRAKLGVYWCPVPWADVHALIQPLVRLGFSVDMAAERREWPRQINDLPISVR